MPTAAVTFLMESLEEPSFGSTSCISVSEKLLRPRRHSSHHPSQQLVDRENLQLSLDQFLIELGRRLDFLESYGHIDFDAGIERAWSTLHAVRDACSRVSDGMIDATRRKAKVLVETLEDRYRDVLATKETLEQKVQEGVHILELLLLDFEASAYEFKETGLGVRLDFLDEGRRKVDQGIGKAREVVDEGLEFAWRAAGTIEHAIERALIKARQQGLLKYHDLPHPWRINEHIICGYRFHDSKLACLRSALSVSNELFNIWSHAIGLLVVLFLAFYFYPTSVHFSLSTKADVFIAGVFFFAAAKCLVCSTIWHTFNSIAEQHLIERFACVDYTGISLLISASIMTTEYTAFYCEPSSRWFWMTTTALVGIAGMILPWNPTFNRGDLAWTRVLFYVTLAGTGLFPVLQLVWSRGLAWAAFFYAPIGKSVLMYLCGAFLYAWKVPERWWPGMFDYIGGSHNIWHLAVLGGILFHYHAMQDLFSKAFVRAFLQCSVY